MRYVPSNRQRIIKKMTVSFSTTPSDYNFGLMMAIQCSSRNREVLYSGSNITKVDVFSVNLLEVFRSAVNVSVGLVRYAEFVPNSLALFITDLEGFQRAKVPFDR